MYNRNMQKPQFVENQIYHIFNRGVEKRNIFMDEKDYFRFMHDLYEFNDEDRVYNSSYFLKRGPRPIEVQPQYIKKRKLLVDILAFVLMPNHFHLILRQRVENGIVKFLQKVGTGYSMYFNQKHERVGSLFQGRFKAVLILKRAHFIHLPFYIHFNPLKLMPNYQSSTSIEDKIDFLKKYRWSSFPDYIGLKNFPSVTTRDDLLEFFDGAREYRKEAVRWLKERDLRLDKNLTFE